VATPESRPPALISSGRISSRTVSALSQRMPIQRLTPSIPALPSRWGALR
jgi:hypothetical protein